MSAASTDSALEPLPAPEVPASEVEVADPPSSTPVRLTSLRAGDRGRLHATRLAGDDGELLRALGLAERRRFRVCKAGDPWILQVRGTRVGMSDAVAQRLLVIPDGRAER